MLKPGLVSVTFRQLEPRHIAALANDAGLAGIEWGGDVHVPPGDLDRAKDVRQITADAGLTVVGYGSYYRAGVSPPSDFAAVLASATGLGAPQIRVWAGIRGSGVTDKVDRMRTILDLHRISALAAECHCRIYVEFHPDTLADGIESTLSLLECVGHPNLWTHWQPRLGESDDVAVAGLSRLSTRLVHVHVFHWDPTPDDRHPLALAAERWQKFLAEASRAHACAYASLEFVKDNDPRQFLRDAATLRQLLDNLPATPVPMEP